MVWMGVVVRCLNEGALASLRLSQKQDVVLTAGDNLGLISLKRFRARE